MSASHLTMSRQVALAASNSQRQRTGHAPESVAVVLNDNVLVIALHGALSPAEKALAQSPQGADQVRQFHRELFRSSADPLRVEIERITGVKVRESSAEVATRTGAVVEIFANGAMVQVFLLQENVSADAWNGIDSSAPPQSSEV